VGCTAPRQHRRARPDLELFVSETEPQPASQDVPRFVIFVVDVQWRNPVVTDLGSPLREDEAVSRSTKSTSC
jgi:hypothetical protein